MAPGPAATVDAILDAMGATPDGPPQASALTVRLDRPADPPARTPDPAGRRQPAGRRPPGRPGCHRATTACNPTTGRASRLIASPGRCPLPAAAGWGFSAQLYATRSRRSWGIGDLGDLEQLATGRRLLGAGFVLVNPLHAASPTRPQQASPYFPGSRCFLNPLYLAVEEIPGRRIPARDLAELARAGRALNSARLIDRDRVWELKSAALEAGFADFAGDPDFDDLPGRPG